MALDRQTEIREIHRKYRTFYEIGGGFTIIALLILVGINLFASDLGGYSANVYTETVSAVASVIVTVLILDKRAVDREERRREIDLKTRLVREARSSVNVVARQAINDLRAYGWLTGVQGLLAEANLGSANLAEAVLTEANLAEAYLKLADLTDADLQDADLSDAFLRFANLDRANLWGARLDGADLVGANLEGADLQSASLVGADIDSAKCDATTMLPDGSRWFPEVDWLIFTDPEHPDFWHPGWLNGAAAHSEWD
jgi:hypothetical protein